MSKVHGPLSQSGGDAFQVLVLSLLQDDHFQQFVSQHAPELQPDF